MKPFVNGYIYNIESVQPIESVSEINKLSDRLCGREHLNHHHKCIKPYHHHPVPQSLNNYRKMHKKPGYKLCLRDRETDKFIKRIKLRTYSKCNHHPEPNCIFNLVKSILKHWQTRARSSDRGKCINLWWKNHFPNADSLACGCGIDWIVKTKKT